ncbi:hypothetical protein CL656_01950 [bacterium]|nr:hypothetical protein [bacterium]|tara:strand:- start:3640 stop:4065 length:426 start_codon:yes stop_codon:yes gene_type:complete
MKSVFKKFLIVILICTSLTFGTVIASAEEKVNQNTQSFGIYKPRKLPGPRFTQDNPTTKEKQRTILNQFLPKFSIRLLVFITIASLLGLIYGGFLYISDLGEEQNLEQAKKAITFSIVGLILAFLSFAIVQIINVIPLDFV